MGWFVFIFFVLMVLGLINPKAGGFWMVFLKEKKRLKVFGLNFTAFIIFIIMAAAMSETDTTKSTTAQVEENSQPQIKIGTPFQTNKFEITILSVNERRTVGGEFFASTASEGALYVVVKYKYKNITKKPISAFSTPTLYLRDASDVRYSGDTGAASSYATEGNNNEKIISELNPGITSTSAEVFEVSRELWKAAGWRLIIEADKDSQMVIK